MGTLLLRDADASPETDAEASGVVGLRRLHPAAAWAIFPRDSGRTARYPEAARLAARKKVCTVIRLSRLEPSGSETRRVARLSRDFAASGIATPGLFGGGCARMSNGRASTVAA